MEITIQLNYEQIMGLIRQMPANQIERIKNEISDHYIQTKAVKDITGFQKFILSAPVMSAEQYEQFKQNRKYFNQWRTS
ncbi:MAG: hypothetical protein LBE56_11385 [Tannerella sp.]|jgi:hypothetical protein|nr:hypothetical protein [Tannerella sp.]